MTEWSVEVFFPMDERWQERDSIAKTIADQHDKAVWLGSGAGFGERDIQWTLPSKKSATALLEDLKKAGFTTQLRKVTW